MPKSRKPVLNDPVPHPRYGSAPVDSGIRVAESVLRRGFWRLSNDALLPKTALITDTCKQNYAVFPRKYYVDVLRNCRRCSRHFIFFAREQRYWFETLRLSVDADCVHCPECRRKSRTLRHRLRRYSDLREKPSLEAPELCQLVDDATFLVEHAVLRNLTAVGTVKNRALREIPDYRGIQRLIHALESARLARNTFT